MSKMPVLDTCTEVTASLLKLPGGRGGRFKLPTLTELHSFLLIKHLGSTTRPPLRLRRVVSGIDSKRELYQRATGCAWVISRNSKIRIRDSL
jgi:hypothetical protein